MTTAALTPVQMPDTKQIEIDRDLNVEKAKSYAVTDQASYDQAAEFLVALRALYKHGQSLFKEPKAKQTEALDSLRNLEKEILEPLKEAADIIKNKTGTWFEEQQAKARAEEAQRRADEKKRQEEQQLAEAEANEKAGDTKGAELVLTKQPAAVPVAPPSAPAVAAPKSAKGVKHRTVYGINNDTINIETLLEAVANDLKKPEAERRGLIEAVQPNTKYLRQLSVAQKDRFNVPGVEQTKKHSVG